MLAAERGIERLHNTIRMLRSRMDQSMPSGTADLSHVTDLMNIGTAFMDAMNDDFNTPKALATLFDFNREVNTLLSSGRPVSVGTLAAIDGLYRELGGHVLGVIPDDLTKDMGSEMVEGLMDIILGIRQRYREAKDWDRADLLRQELGKLGIVAEDRPEGTTWRIEK
jgi:cysteinyl-tRNA synthetase